MGLSQGACHTHPDMLAKTFDLCPFTLGFGAKGHTIMGKTQKPLPLQDTLLCTSCRLSLLLCMLLIGLL